MEGVDYQAGMFEHVAKMSRISEQASGAADPTQLPPVRYCATMPALDPSGMPAVGMTPIVRTLNPPVNTPGGATGQQQAPIPVKLRLLHPLSNQTTPDLVPSEVIIDPPSTAIPATPGPQRHQSPDSRARHSSPDASDRERRAQNKRQRREQKRKAKQKKAEEEGWVDQPQDDPEGGSFRSPNSKMMQEARHQRWKTSPWQQPEMEQPVEEHKSGRNMRAAPLHQSDLSSRSTNPSERSRQKSRPPRPPHPPRQPDPDAKTAAKLLSQTFSLSNTYPHSAPASPPPHSSNQSERSAMTEPTRGRSGLYYAHSQGSALDSLYYRGSMTRPDGTSKASSQDHVMKGASSKNRDDPYGSSLC